MSGSIRDFLNEGAEYNRKISNSLFCVYIQGIVVMMILRKKGENVTLRAHAQFQVHFKNPYLPLVVLHTPKGIVGQIFV